VVFLLRLLIDSLDIFEIVSKIGSQRLLVSGDGVARMPGCRRGWILSWELAGECRALKNGLPSPLGVIRRRFYEEADTDLVAGGQYDADGLRGF
jgi:hypothetical protein